MYYLQSRYYDPEVCRFINADNTDNLAANGDFTSYNLYAYCGNNPVARQDDGGDVWHVVAGAVLGGIIGGIVAAVNGESVVAGIISGVFVGGLTALIGPAGASVGGFIWGTFAIGAISATGEYINQVGNNIANGQNFSESSRNVDGKEILEAGVVGTVLAPVSIGGAKLLDSAFSGINSMAGKTAKFIVNSVMDIANSIVNGITRSIM